MDEQLTTPFKFVDTMEEFPIVTLSEPPPVAVLPITISLFAFAVAVTPLPI